MSLQNNTTELQAILDAVNALPEAGGGGGEVNTGVCTVTIVPPLKSTYIVCFETVSMGEIEYMVIKKTNTTSNIIVEARCDSVLYIQAAAINDAEITGGEILSISAGNSLAYKTPSTADTSAQINVIY